MKNLKNDYYEHRFSHIYVESKIANHPVTAKILEKFPNSCQVEIDHYKDVFCRGKQDVSLQHHSQKLILAKKEGQRIYKGAPVCQNFGNEHFYYTSCVMNCIFDCEYCYLRGMYPSANLVLFVNLEDIFLELEELLQKHPVYLCVSYDTDLLALEGIAGYVEKWVDFAGSHRELTLEIRTKSANLEALKRMRPLDNVIYAFTMSPEPVCDRYERGTPDLKGRIHAVSTAIQLGHPVRLCFDPMIYCPDWKEHYQRMVGQIFAQIESGKLLDVSVGSFRVSKEYLKKMRKMQPDSAVVQFPFENSDGYYHYPQKIMKEMEDFLIGALRTYIPKNKIFLWREEG